MGNGLSRAASTIAAFAVSASAASVYANPLELFGAGPRASALGQTTTARPGDWGSLWHNPAGLASAAPQMALGALFAVDDVAVRPKARPAGYDLPDVGNHSPQIPTAARLRRRAGTENLDNVTDFTLGAVGSFGLPNVRFAVGAVLPMTRLGAQDSRFADEREQYASNRLDFELLGRRSQHQVILVGLGYQALPWLAVGASMSVMPSATAVTDVYLDDPGRQQNVRIAVHNEQAGRVAPAFGLRVTPHARWAIGLSYRRANQFDLTIENHIQIKGFHGDEASFPIIQRVHQVLHYSPDQGALGVAWQVDDLALAVDAVWSRWSQYIDTQGERPTDWSDTLAMRAGAQWQANPERLLRVGLQWEPTPVPAQTQRSNYVDNDRVVASVGGGHRVAVLGQSVLVGWSLGLHHLVARATDKALRSSYPACAPGQSALCDEVADTTPAPNGTGPMPQAQGLQTGNPGFPGFVSHGNLLVIGLDMRWDF